jgi:3'-phosphoadenosine 5'-phosphosulfate sulfotransferase (PAPS reductase)/FAD synthetase
MDTVLQFSGGKDSLACLYLLKDRWSEIQVVWLNSGAMLPEAVTYMEGIKRMVPHFLEVQARQTIEQRGWPTDIVPTRSTPSGLLATGQWPKDSPTPLFQSRFDCCAATIWQPLRKAMQDVGAKVIIRGQKLSDPMRSPIVHGQVVDGIEYQFPLADWTDADVERYLESQHVSTVSGSCMPNSSLDCWNCTAYLDESGPKLKYLKAHHPQKHRHVMQILRALNRAVNSETRVLRDTLAEQRT